MSQSRQIRKRKIVELLRHRQEMTVAEIGENLGVSDATVRRDLWDLDRDKAVIRTYGGAKDASDLFIEKSIRVKEERQIQTKQQIAKHALAFIHDHDVVMLDAGTTTAKIAQQLLDHPELEVTVITVDILIATLLYAAPHIQVLMVGGQVGRAVGNVQGHYAVEMLSQLRADVSFIGTSSVGGDMNIYTPSEQKIELKRLLLTQAEKTVLVCDRSKFESRSLHRIAPLSCFDAVITDYCFSTDQQTSCEKNGVEYVRVPGEDKMSEVT